MRHTRWQADSRSHRLDFALTGGQLFLLFVGLNLQSRTGWQISLALIAATSFWAWVVHTKRYRTVADTPTSRIGSAPQGYVELVGRGRYAPGNPPRRRISGLPCLWHRYRIERESDGHWEYLESGGSSEPFDLDDGSGRVRIDPAGAEILVSDREISTREGYRTIEWTLIEGETIYVIGEHATLSPAHALREHRSDMAEVLAEWKRNPAALRARYDANRDGEIDLDEWEKVRRDAAAQVDRAHQAARLEPDVQVMRKPAHGQPYLIANRDVASLVRHFRIWSWIHLAWLAGAIAGLSWAARLP